MASVSVCTDVKCGGPEQLRGPRPRQGPGLGPGGRPGVRPPRLGLPSPRPKGCARAQTPGLGQVAVGVLLPIHSLQILLLDKNVNAFLRVVFRGGRGREEKEKHIYRREREGFSHPSRAAPSHFPQSPLAPRGFPPPPSGLRRGRTPGFCVKRPRGSVSRGCRPPRAQKEPRLRDGPPTGLRTCRRLPGRRCSL